MECPLCMELLDSDDKSFYPCSCGYQICRFCWHRLRSTSHTSDFDSNQCPACRKPYQDQPANFKPAATTCNQDNNKKKSNKKKISKKELAELRVLQKNLIFVVGLSAKISDVELLKKGEYFGRFGRILKVVVNQASVGGKDQQGSTAYITYSHPFEALRAVTTVNNTLFDGRLIKVNLGTTKYCSHFLKNQSCPKSECMYLHSVGDEEASFTKEDMLRGRHSELERRLVEEWQGAQQQQQQQEEGVQQHTSTTKRGAVAKVVTTTTTAGTKSADTKPSSVVAVVKSTPPPTTAAGSQKPESNIAMATTHNPILQTLVFTNSREKTTSSSSQQSQSLVFTNSNLQQNPVAMVSREQPVAMVTKGGGREQSAATPQFNGYSNHSPLTLQQQTPLSREPVYNNHHGNSNSESQLPSQQPQLYYNYGGSSSGDFSNHRGSVLLSHDEEDGNHGNEFYEEDDLGFDPFAETQKQFEELIREELMKNRREGGGIISGGGGGVGPATPPSTSTTPQQQQLTYSNLSNQFSNGFSLMGGRGPPPPFPQQQQSNWGVPYQPQQQQINAHPSNLDEDDPAIIYSSRVPSQQQQQQVNQTNFPPLQSPQQHRISNHHQSHFPPLQQQQPTTIQHRQPPNNHHHQSSSIRRPPPGFY